MVVLCCAVSAAPSPLYVCWGVRVVCACVRVCVCWAAFLLPAVREQLSWLHLDGICWVFCFNQNCMNFRHPLAVVTKMVVSACVRLLVRLSVASRKGGAIAKN